jgi:hypothetical protein
MLLRDNWNLLNLWQFDTINWTIHLTVIPLSGVRSIPIPGPPQIKDVSIENLFIHKLLTWIWSFDPLSVSFLFCFFIDTHSGKDDIGTP